MERRYLVATVAILATFAVTSHGFRALQRISLGHGRHCWVMARIAAMAKPGCESSAAARAMTRLRTHLRPRYPEEAQLLAEMNVPIANMEAAMAEQMAKQNAAVANCARARAMQDAERARRDAMRWQERMTRANRAPIALELNLPSDLDQRIQAQTTALAARLAASNVKLQMAADKFRENAIRIDDLDLPAVVVTDDGGRVSSHVHTHVHCNVKSKTAGKQPE